MPHFLTRKNHWNFSLHIRSNTVFIKKLNSGNLKNKPKNGLFLKKYIDKAINIC